MNFRFVVFLCFVVLWSCSDNQKQNKENLVFRYNESSNIATLDPAFARTQSEIWIANQLFNGLVQLDDSLNIQPDIAKKWTISEDGMQYLFTLRNDVFFIKTLFFPTIQEQSKPLILNTVFLDLQTKELLRREVG